jgi:predicted ArsR family transcriptional regulator
MAARDADLEAIGLLQDPARRALYEYVVGTGREVGRNEAAEAVGIQRTLAAFHLDRLAEAGLLSVDFRRLTGKSGPGAGRPAKLYRRPHAEHEHAVSLPARTYDTAAEVFAEAIERAGAEETLYATAREQGIAAGRGISGLQQALADRGYEPYASESGDGWRLRNCPFHTLAQGFPSLACGMNLALLEGLLSGAGLEETFTARLDPRPEGCCVLIDSKNNHS